MRAVGVWIHHYRGIDDVTIPLSPLTVLVGSNGAGKSSILEALGYDAHEHGAVGRQRDAAARLSWYLAPDDRQPLGELLLGAGGAGFGVADQDGGSEALEQVVKEIRRCLVIRLDPDGHHHLALDLFELLGDLPMAVRRPRSRPLVGKLKKAQSSGAAWVDRLHHLLVDELDELPCFLDIDVDLGPDFDVDVGGGERAYVEPERVSMVASPDDLSPILRRCVGATAVAAYAPLIDVDREVVDAVDAYDSGRLAPLRRVGVLDPVIRLLEDELNELLPPFVSRLGTVVIDCLDGPDTAAGAAMSLIDDAISRADDETTRDLLTEARTRLLTLGDTADLHLDSHFVEVPSSEHDVNGGGRYAYSRLGTGFRRWVCGALDEASRRLEAGFLTQPLTLDEARRSIRAERLEARRQVRPATSVRLIDEPVDSLEPRVHAEVVAWLRGHVNDRESLVLSSHHASVLGVGRPDDLEVIGVYRQRGNVRVVPMGPGLLGSLRQHLGTIGLSREELMFGVRALLLLEGVDDVALVRALYGEELDRRSVLVHPVGGSDARAILAAIHDTAYALLALPTWVMLDHRFDDQLDERWRWTWRDDQPPDPGALSIDPADIEAPFVKVLPLEAVDIALAVTPAAYRTLAGWEGFRRTTAFDEPDDVIIDHWRRITTSGASKTWVERALGQAPGSFSSKIVPALADLITVGGNPTIHRSVWINSAMERFFGELDALRHPNVFEQPPPDP